MRDRFALVLIFAALGIGFIAGGLFKGSGATSEATADKLLAGAPYGACSALEAAKAEKILPPEAASRLYGEFLEREEKLIQRYDRNFQFRRQDQNCPRILLDLQYKIRETRD